MDRPITSNKLYEEIMASGENSVALKKDSVRRVYLVTYSCADIDVWQRHSFADAVISCFHDCTATKVVQWACCMEPHKDGGFHFHLCVLLNQCQRWLKVKNAMRNNFGITVNFSGHSGYHTAYGYVKKEDSGFITSPGHPVDIAAPKTANATKKNCKKLAKRAKKVVKMNNLMVSDIILKERIHTMLELLAFANSKKISRDPRLYEFILNRGQKKVSELLKSVWDMNDAKAKLERSAQSRLEILQSFLKEECLCEGQWIACALEILHNNKIDRAVFADALVKLLAMGRGKGRNIYIYGPANCGKTFIMDPLRYVFKAFLSPATCSYAWLGVEDKEVIFLNDFRYSTVILNWSDMLLLLEGHVVHFAAPKTAYSKDIEFDKDTPVFATSKSPILFLKNGVVDDRETEMMNVRWRMFNFHHQIPVEQQKSVASCPHCFARLLLE